MYPYKSTYVARKYTSTLLELIEGGVLDPKEIIKMCVGYMSEQEVKDMVICNDLEEVFGIDDEEAIEEDIDDEED